MEVEVPALALGLGIMGGAAVANALGQGMSGLRARKSAEAQARSQKAAMNMYATALQTKAAKERGGISDAQRRQMAAGGSMQRASEAQRARDEAARGRGSRDLDIEEKIVEATQAGAAQQMQGIDALSQQQAQAAKARRDQLELASMQATQQAQSIDPEAIGKAAAAGVPAAVTGSLAQPAMAAGQALAAPGLQMQGQTGALASVSGAQSWGDLTPEEQEAATNTWQALMGSPDA